MVKWKSQSVPMANIAGHTGSRKSWNVCLAHSEWLSYIQLEVLISSLILLVTGIIDG
jgi:hypothetical protein